MYVWIEVLYLFLSKHPIHVFCSLPGSRSCLHHIAAQIHTANRCTMHESYMMEHEQLKIYASQLDYGNIFVLHTIQRTKRGVSIYNKPRIHYNFSARMLPFFSFTLLFSFIISIIFFSRFIPILFALSEQIFIT